MFIVFKILTLFLIGILCPVSIWNRIVDVFSTIKTKVSASIFMNKVIYIS